MGAAFRKAFENLFRKQLSTVLVGLDNSGKTTLQNVLVDGAPTDTIPTIGLNMRTVKKGKVTLKCCDIGGQENFRREWVQYAKGTDAIIFVIDASNRERVPEARHELHRLLENSELATTPVLVLANKIDLQPHMSEAEIVQELNLDYIVDNPWIVLPCSALKGINIAQVIDWLLSHSDK